MMRMINEMLPMVRHIYARMFGQSWSQPANQMHQLQMNQVGGHTGALNQASGTSANQQVQGGEGQVPASDNRSFQFNAGSFGSGFC